MTFTPTQIAYEVDGPVATITLDRPDRLNAFTVEMMSELLQAFDLADGDDGVRAVIHRPYRLRSRRPRHRPRERQQLAPAAHRRHQPGPGPTSATTVLSRATPIAPPR